MRAPVAYIRRSSKSRSDPGDISREFQTETVRRLAGPDGASLRILDGDWGRSASTDKTDQRLAFLSLLEEVERGEVSVIYAYATDRLARSVEWAARLLNACRRADTPIVTSEGRFEPDNAMTDQLFYFQAMQNEGYSRQSSQKRRATIERMRARGSKLGQPFYGALPGESVDAVIDAYSRAGSMNAAAKLLNAGSVKSRRGHWAPSSIQRILARAGIVPFTGVRGAKHRQPHLFARLLRCHCGHTMTPSRRSGGTTLYRCVRGQFDADHGRTTVNERPVLEWAVEEMERLRPPTDLVSMASSLDEERHALTVRLDRLRVAFLAGLVEEPQMRAEKAEIDEAIMRLELAGRAVRVPAFDWNHEPRDLNLALRALWEYVELGPDLRPVRAAWLVPESWLAPPGRGSPAALPTKTS